MIKTLLNTLRIFICTALTVQLIGCGTLMYPERKGQRGGHVDVGVAVLDGIGLFFFLIPGIIAYAIDFSNGTIYLPRSMSFLDIKNMKQVKFDPNTTNMASIDKIIKKETGYNVQAYKSQMRISKLKSSQDMSEHFCKAVAEIQNDRLALLKIGNV